MKKTPPANADWRVPLQIGLAVVFLFFGVFVGWAAYAPVDSAIVAPGVIAAEGSRQTIQHLEGGIIRSIRVRDGQHVQEGDVLFVLEPTAVKANAEVLQGQLYVQLAREARLLAERDGKATIDFPKELADSQNPNVLRAIADETQNFLERSRNLKNQVAVLRNRIQSFKLEIEGLLIEHKAAESQVTTIESELPGLRSLLARNLTQMTRVTTLERERSRMSGIVARTLTDRAKAERSIGEAELMIQQAESDAQRGIAADLIECRKALGELRERYGVANDSLKRLEIVAPKSGVAQGRRFSTVGAVIRPGDVVIDIAPFDAPVIVRAQVDPRDVDLLRIGMAGQVRFQNFKAREVPALFGQVRALSNDRVVDSANPDRAYFFIELQVDMSAIPAEYRERVRVGMPAEVILPTGERSVMRYVMQPLENNWLHALREK